MPAFIFSHALMLNKNPNLWIDTKQIRGRGFLSASGVIARFKKTLSI